MYSNSEEETKRGRDSLRDMRGTGDKERRARGNDSIPLLSGRIRVRALSSIQSSAGKRKQSVLIKDWINPQSDSLSAEQLFIGWAKLDPSSEGWGEKVTLGRCESQIAPALRKLSQRHVKMFSVIHVG